METKPSQSKVETWSRTIAQWRDSGQTVAAFCRARRISGPSFYQWRRRLGGPKAAAEAKRPAGFVPVSVIPMVPRGCVAEFELGSGRMLRLFGEVTVERLAGLAKALEEAGC